MFVIEKAQLDVENTLPHFMAFCRSISIYSPRYGRVRLEPNERQSALAERLFADEKHICWEKDRQDGTSTLLAAYCAYKAMLGRTQIGLCGTSVRSTNYMLRMIREMLLRDGDIVRNIEDQIVLGNGSCITSFGSTSTRGYRFDVLIAQEFDYVRDKSKMSELMANMELAARKTVYTRAVAHHSVAMADALLAALKLDRKEGE